MYDNACMYHSRYVVYTPVQALLRLQSLSLLQRGFSGQHIHSEATDGQVVHSARCLLVAGVWSERLLHIEYSLHM